MPQCATLVLASAIEEFVRRKPLAQIQVAHGPYAFLLNDLRMGKIDFLFGVLRKPEWATDVKEEPLFDAPYAIIARKNHPLSRKKTIRLDDLADYDWILPQRGAPRRVAFETMFDGGRQPRVGVETSRSDLQATLIGSSDRLTMMSAQEARRLAGTGKIIVVDYKPGVTRGCDGIAIRTNWHPTAGNRMFLEIIRKHGRSYSPAAQDAVVPGSAGRTGRSSAAKGSRRTQRERVSVRSAPYSNASGR
jgi:DNA-binding transcriptional LysR family regulator